MIDDPKHDDWRTLPLAGKLVFPSTTIELWAFRRIPELVADMGGDFATELTPEVAILFVGEDHVDEPCDAERQVIEWNKTQDSKILIFDYHQAIDYLSPSREQIDAMLNAGAEGLERLRHRLKWAMIEDEFEISGVSWPGIDFSSTYLEKLKFIDCDLRGGNFENSNFSSFINCNLAGANLNGCEASHYENCDLRDVVLRNNSWGLRAIQNCDLTGSELSSTHFSNNEGAFEGSDFSNTKLHRLVAQNADLSGLNFQDADLTNSMLMETSFRGSKLSGATLDKCWANGINLSGADLRGASLKGCCLIDADLTNARLSGADLSNANLIGARLTGADLDEVVGMVTACVDVPGSAGPRVEELDRVALAAKEVKTYLELEHASEDLDVWISSSGGSDKLWMQFMVMTKGGAFAGSNDTRVDSFREAMLQVARTFPMGIPDLASIDTSSKKSDAQGVKLRRLVLDAWCEVFGLPLQSEEELKERVSDRRTKHLERAQPIIDLIRDPDKQHLWRQSVWCSDQPVFDYTDCTNLELDFVPLDYPHKVHFGGLSFHEARFDGSRFRGVSMSSEGAHRKRNDYKHASFKNVHFDECVMSHGDFDRATFEDATLIKCDFSKSSLTSCNFRGADLSGSKMNGCKLRGADFSEANLESVTFEDAVFDESTTFPNGFTMPKTQ